MRIIHMSDLHLTSDKHPIWGVDTYEHFVKTLNSIDSIPNIDCIVVSGDIADDGNLLTYQYADDMLNSLSIPVLWCPGPFFHSSCQGELGGNCSRVTAGQNRPHVIFNYYKRK